MDSYRAEISAVETDQTAERESSPDPATAPEETKAKREPSPDPDIELKKLLSRTKTLVRNRRKTMVNGILAIAEQIKCLSASKNISKSQIRAFLISECGIDRADLNTYLKLTDLSDECCDELRKAGTSLAVMKTLVGAPVEVRDDVFEKLKLGHFIHSRDVTAMRRRHAARLTDPRVAEENRRLKALRSSAQSKAQSDLTAFSDDFMPFIQSLIDLFNEGLAGTVAPDDYRSRRPVLIKEAERCLARFEALFDISSLPPIWDGYCEQLQPDAARLSRAHDGLKALATGKWKAVDPESGNPYDREDTLVDRSILESLVWLFEGNGFDVGQLKSRKVMVPAVPKADRPVRRLTSLEICAGAGGQALGLHAAGFHAIATFERNKDAVASLKANGLFGHVHAADITEVDFRRYRGKVDLVAGGVPCQPHSRAGKQKGCQDERDLFLEAVRIVDEVQPKAFFFENVSGFTDAPATAYRAKLHQRFNSLGYENRVFTFWGRDLGLGQLRPRTAFIGFRDVPMERFRMPPKFPEWETTLGKVLHDLVAANGWKGAENWATNVAIRTCSTIVGGSEKSGSQGFVAKARAEDWEALGVDWTQLADSAPGPDHPTDGRFRLTLEMGARLQGFPDDWIFCGSKRSRRRQIANALPPIMARAVGLAIYSALTGVEFDFGKALKLPLPDKPRGALRLSALRSDGGIDDDDPYAV